METVTPDFVETAIRNLVSADRTNLGVEVAVPVLYPNGDMVTIVVETTNTGVIVHDAGFAAMRLHQTGVKASAAVSKRMKEYAARFRCEFIAGRVSASSEIDALGVSCCLVANAARSIADFGVEIRRQSETEFRQILSEMLREIVGARLRENEEVVGNSGRRYRLSAIILDKEEKNPINYVSAIANRQAVSNSFAMLYDLRGKSDGAESDLIYDENSDIRGEDKLFLGSVGNLFTFSEAKTHFPELLSSAVGSA